MIKFFAGVLVALVAVTFIGWFDVKYLGRPKTEPTFNNKVKMYVFVVAWEALFFATGVVVGWSLK